MLVRGIFGRQERRHTKAHLTVTTDGIEAATIGGPEVRSRDTEEPSAAHHPVMARHLAIPRLPAQLGAFLVSAFAILALVLAVIGLYGVVSYTVASRAREVGIRNED